MRTQLSWTHYKTLISLDNPDKREFYLAEAAKNNWSARQLERQVNSQLFERLLLSNDVAAVLAVARQEKPPTEAHDIIKDPMVLKFLGRRQEQRGGENQPAGRQPDHCGQQVSTISAH